MIFTEPGGLLLLLFLPLFLLLRISLRRKPLILPSFHLLREIVDSLPLLPRSYLLRRRIQTALLTASVVSLGLAAGGPLLGAADSDPLRVIVVLDHLFGFAAGDGKRAADEAARAIEGLRADDTVMLVRSDTGSVTEGFVSPRRAAAEARRQTPSELPFDSRRAEDALLLLTGTLRPDYGLVVTPFPSRWRDLIPKGGDLWSTVPAPSPPPAPNFAILDVDLLPDLLRPGRASLYCRVGAFPPGSATGTPVVISVSLDGRTLERREVFPADDGTAGALFRDLAVSRGLLSVTIDPTDSFPPDNTFLAPFHDRPFLSAALVTAGSPALEAALRALPGLDLSVFSPGVEPDAAEGAVTIFDGQVPGKLAGSTLLVRPFGGLPDMPVEGEAAGVAVISADGTHPLLEGVSFASLSVGRMPILAPGPGMEVLARGDGRPLLLAGRASSGVRLVVFAFDPVEEGWVYDPSFPILVANAVSWLGLDTRASASSFRIGDSTTAKVLGGAGGLEGPLGAGHRFAGEEAYTFPLSGRYRVEGGSAKDGEIFVNLLNEEVSAAVVPAADASGGSTPLPFTPRPFRLLLHVPLLVLGILLLLLESLVAPPAAVGRLPR